MKKYYLEVKVDGDRVDTFIANEIKFLSRAKVQKMIKASNVKVNDRGVKSNYILKTGDNIVIEYEEEIEKTVEPEEIELNIVYQDDDLAVVYKPQGMVVHPGDGNWEGTLVNALLFHMDSLSDMNEDDIRPGIVHRIDKDTSGLIVVAKNNEAHKSLAEQLEAHSVKRKYIALVEGKLKEESGTIDLPLARNSRDRKKMAVVEGGRRAITHFKVLQRFNNYTLIEAQLETGRTHQIRVHMNYIKHPIVGDPVYGIKKQKFKLDGQLLHAETIGFIHPRTGEYMEFNASIPEYFEKIIGKLS